MFNDIEQLEKEVQAFRQNMLGSASLIRSLEGLLDALKAQTRELSARSSEMTGRLDSQYASIQTKSDEVLNIMAQKLSAGVADMRAVTDGAAMRLSTDNKTYMDTAVSRIRETQKDYIDAVQASQRAIERCEAEVRTQARSVMDQLCAENRKNLDDTASRIQAAQQDYIAAVQAAKTAMGEYEAAFEHHSQALTDQLCAENRKNLDDTISRLLASQKAYTDKLQTTEQVLQAYSTELGQKYADFLDRLERTNIDQIYQYCVSMRKGIETRMTILMAGVGAAVVLALVGLFI